MSFQRHPEAEHKLRQVVDHLTVTWGQRKTVGSRPKWAYDPTEHQLINKGFQPLDAELITLEIVAFGDEDRIGRVFFQSRHELVPVLFALADRLMLIELP